MVAVEPQRISTNRCTVHFSRDGQSLLVASTDLGLVRIPIRFRGRRPDSRGGEHDRSCAGVLDRGRVTGRNIAVLTGRKGICKVVRLDGKPKGSRWPLAGAAGAAFVDDARSVLANSVEEGHGAVIELHDASTGEIRRSLHYPNGAHVHARQRRRIVLGAGEDKSYLLRVADWSPGPALPAEVQSRGKQPAISPDGSSHCRWRGRCCLPRAYGGRGVARPPSIAAERTYLPGLRFSLMAAGWPCGGKTAS